MKGHTAVYRATRGRVGHRLGSAPPSLLLDHVGAKSGTKRTAPLYYLSDGANLVVVASKGGYPQHRLLVPQPPREPRHHGAGRVRSASRAGSRGHPRGANDACGARMVELYGDYQAYQDRAEREIPLFILEPAVA